MSTLAIIPAKRHSVGVPDKNWKPITRDGWNCASLAITISLATCDRAVLSVDDGPSAIAYNPAGISHGPMVVHRPNGLPDTMLAVVQDALAQVPGPDDEIIVLLQPSSPLRTAETVRKAIQMLEDNPEATSVVSVSPSYPWEWSLRIDGDILESCAYPDDGLRVVPTRRQDCQPTYRRDGVVYVLSRKNVVAFPWDIYGWCPLAFHTPPAEALSIDTQADWDEAVRRLSNSAGSLGADTSARP